MKTTAEATKPERQRKSQTNSLHYAAPGDFMKNHECRRNFSTLFLLIATIAIALSLGACTSPEKAKAQHVSRGQALLKDKKFQDAALEFRSALQVDERMADAHWGLANAYEGMQRFQEAFDEMKQTVDLDA